MATVADILRKKGSGVIGLPSTATVLEAARLMNERGVGSVVVIDQGALVGIFSERDVMRRVVAEQREPAGVRLREVMTTTVYTCTPAMPLAECQAIMSSQRIRHLPVVDANGLCGLLSSGDVMAQQVAEQRATIQDLNAYVFGVTP